jgi:hypothetical protein
VPSLLSPDHLRDRYKSVLRRAEQLRASEGREVELATVLFEIQAMQLIHIVVPLGVPERLGLSDVEDRRRWRAMRVNVDICRQAIDIARATFGPGYATRLDRNAAIADCVDALINERGGPREPADPTLAERKARLDAATPRRPHRRAGVIWGDRSKDVCPLGPRVAQRDFFLQSPQDHWCRTTRDAFIDAELSSLLDAWVREWMDNYEQLVEGSQDALGLDHAEIAVEGVIGGEPTAGSGSMPSPAKLKVERHVKGDTEVTLAIATDLLALDAGSSPQPDGIQARSGERWRIYGHRLGDGTVMPCTGTHRLSPAA